MLTKTRLGQSTPEAQGIASAAIVAFVEAVEAAGLELHSFMLLRHGKAVAKGWWSPYAADLRHMLPEPSTARSGRQGRSKLAYA